MTLLRGLSAILLFFLAVLASSAETLRVVAWPLEPAVTLRVRAKTPLSQSNAVARSAFVLRQLNPDIVILYDVLDWKNCQDLVAALEPAKYSVHVCSSFPASTKTADRPRQLAILAKQKAYFSWSEEWEPTNPPGAGGFSFVALQAGSQRIGVFVVGVAGAHSRDIDSREALQWAKAVGGFKKWATNKLEAGIIAFRVQGSADPASVEAGLARPFTKTLTLPSGAANSFSATLPTDAAALPVLLFGQNPLVCDLDVSPANPLQASARRLDPALASAPGADLLNLRVVLWSAAILATLGLMALLWIIAVLRRRVRRLAAPRAVALLGSGDADAYPDTVVIALKSATATSPQTPPGLEAASPLPVVNIESDAGTSTQSQRLRRLESAQPAGEPFPEAVQAGVIAGLTHWLKNAFVRRVLAERETLLEGQRQAGSKAAHVDARLAKVEVQIQQQTQIYEERIQELTRELEQSRQENRALILAKIAQVKREMEAARARIARAEP